MRSKGADQLMPPSGPGPEGPEPPIRAASGAGDQHRVTGAGVLVGVDRLGRGLRVDEQHEVIGSVAIGRVFLDRSSQRAGLRRDVVREDPVEHLVEHRVEVRGVEVQHVADLRDLPQQLRHGRREGERDLEVGAGVGGDTVDEIVAAEFEQTTRLGHRLVGELDARVPLVVVPQDDEVGRAVHADDVDVRGHRRRPLVDFGIGADSARVRDGARVLQGGRHGDQPPSWVDASGLETGMQTIPQI